MAIYQNPLLQLLTQLQGGGGPPISPSSGLQNPSLSGLALGEQGMGLGGGGSILGGGGQGLGGGTEGLGLDLLSLLSQPEVAAGGQPPLGQALRFPPLGLPPETPPGADIPPPGFGAGGPLLPPQGRVGGAPARAGLGMGVGGLLGTLSALLKLGKSVGGVFNQVLPSTPPTGIPGSAGVPPEGQAAYQAQRAGEFFPDLQSALALGFTRPEAQALTGAFGPLSASDAAALQGPGAGNVAQAQAMVNQGIFPGATTNLGEAGLGVAGLPAVSGPDLLGAGGVFGEVGPEVAAGGAGSLGLGSLAPVLGGAAAGVGGISKLIGGQTAREQGIGAGQSALALAALLDPEPISKLFLGALGTSIGLMGGNKFNDFNAAQTEAALRNAGALARQGGPAEQLMLQRHLDNILFQNIGQFDMSAGSASPFGGAPTQTLTGEPLPPSIGQRMVNIAHEPQATLSPQDIAGFGNLLGPVDFYNLLGAIEGQRRYRTFAGLPTLAAPPPSIENANVPTDPMLLAVLNRRQEDARRQEAINLAINQYA